MCIFLVKKIELSTRKEPGLYTEWIDEKDVRNIGDGVIAIYLTHRNDAILKLFNSLVPKSDLSTEKNRENSNIINFKN